MPLDPSLTSVVLFLSRPTPPPLWTTQFGGGLMALAQPGVTLHITLCPILLGLGWRFPVPFQLHSFAQAFLFSLSFL